MTDTKYILPFILFIYLYSIFVYNLYILLFLTVHRKFYILFNFASFVIP